MNEQMWTGIARCKVCKKELNRAENVPESEKQKVIMTAPLMAVCDVKAHNAGFSDVNFGVEIEWSKLNAEGIE